MTRRKYVNRVEIEHFDSPKQSMNGWKNHEQFEYRVSWRIYTKENGEELRDYRICAELDIPIIVPEIEEWFGPYGPKGRWDIDYGYMYLFFRTLADITEFRLRINLPG